MNKALFLAALLCSTSALAYNEGANDASLFGVVGDGQTDVTANLTRGLVKAGNVSLTAGKTYILNSLTIGDHQTLSCNHAILKPANGAGKLLTLSGFNSKAIDCTPFDPALTLQRSTTVKGAVSPNTSVIPVQNASTCQVGMVVTVQLDSAAGVPVFWTSKITAGDLINNTLTLADPVPWTIKTAAVAAGGTGGWLNGSNVVVNAAAPTASGAPATANIIANGTSVTGINYIAAPGMWQANPGSPISITSPAVPGANSATLTLTYGGLPDGGYFDCAFPLVIVDNAANGVISGMVIPEAAVGIGIMNTSLNAGYTTAMKIDAQVNNATMVGLFKDIHTSNLDIDVSVQGYTHHGSPFGAAGIYIAGDAGAAAPASGGSRYLIRTIGFEIGILDQKGVLDEFLHVNSDSLRNYTIACFGCVDTDITSAYAAFSGPTANAGTAGDGGGVVFTGSAINNKIAALTTHDSAFDVFLGDQTSGVWLPTGTWSWSKIVLGFMNSIQPGTSLVNIATSATLSGSSVLYAAPGYLGASEGPSVLVNTNGTVTDFGVSLSAVPGGGVTDTFSLRINHWNGSSYGGFTTVGQCQVSGASATKCIFTGPGVKVYKQDQIDFAVAPSGGSLSGTMQAYVNGL